MTSIRSQPVNNTDTSVHPTETKSASGVLTCLPIEGFVRRVVVIKPKQGNVRHGTNELVKVLREFADFQLFKEFTYDIDSSSCILDLNAATLHYGVIINDVGVVDRGLWTFFQEVRCGGVIVMNYEQPGPCHAHRKHIELSAIVPKIGSLYSANLEKRCHLLDDGYRELTIQVVSGPDMHAERLILRNKMFPRLVERCRTRRVRPIYVDLRQTSSLRGSGLALRTAQVAHVSAIHIVLISGTCLPEVKIRGESPYQGVIHMQDSVVSTGNFDRAEGNITLEECTCTLVEYILGRVLQLETTPAWIGADSLPKQNVSLPRNSGSQNPQHVLSYVNTASFSRHHSITGSKTNHDRTRCATVISTLYAHPNASVHPYCTELPPGNTFDAEGEDVFARTSFLEELVSRVLEDVWLRVSREFPPNPSDDVFMWLEQEPEFSLRGQLPFYLSRLSQERSVLRCIKLGRPKVIFIGGLPECGISSMLQNCARDSRKIHGKYDHSAQAGVLVLSVFPGIGRAHYSPTQVFRLLVASLHAHRLHQRDIPGGYNAARAMLLSSLREFVSVSRRVVIFIDAVTAIENPRGIAWFFCEEELPPGVQVVVGGHVMDDTMSRSLKRCQESLFSQEGSMLAAPLTLLHIQHMGLIACIPEAMSRVLHLGPLQFTERKIFITKHFKNANIEVEDALLFSLMNVPALASIAYAHLVVDGLCSVYRQDNFDLPKFIADLPANTTALLSSRLDYLETVFPRSTLAIVLPAITLSCNSLTLEDITTFIVMTLDEEEKTHLYSIVAPFFLWEARYFVIGPFEGTYKIASNTAARVIFERYSTDGATKRSTFRLLADFFGSFGWGRNMCFPRITADKLVKSLHNETMYTSVDVPHLTSQSLGKEILAHMHKLPSHALDKNMDAEIIHPAAFQEYHLVFNAIQLLPYYLTRSCQFLALCALLRDFSFIQAKLEHGEVAALLADYDRILQTVRPMWFGVRDLDTFRDDTPNFDQLKPNDDLVCNSLTPSVDSVAFRKWILSWLGKNSTLLSHMLAYRDFLLRNMAELHTRPRSVLQVAMNAPGWTAPGVDAEKKVRDLSAARAGSDSLNRGIQKYTSGERFMLLWDNRPEDAPVLGLYDADVHTEAVTSCAWVDGSTFITGGEEGLVVLWSSSTGECVARMWGHTLPVSCLIVVDIVDHGRCILSGSKDCTVRLWNIEEGLGQTSQVLVGHTCAVTALAFSTLTRELISVGLDRRFVIWDLTSVSVRQLHIVDTVHLSPLTSAAFSPAGNIFVTGSVDGHIHVWSMALCRNFDSSRRRDDDNEDRSKLAESHRNAELTLKLQGHLSDVTCCAFGQSDNLLATGSMDHSIMLWNPMSGTHTGVLVGHTATVTDLCYSTDSEVLLSTSTDRYFRIWSLNSGETMMKLQHGHSIYAGKFSPDSSQVLVVGDGKFIGLWNWVGRMGSASVGKVPPKPGLFVEGFVSEKYRGKARKLESSFKDSSDSSVNRIFDGHAHSGAMITLACFSSAQECPISVLSGGRDGLIRKFSVRKSVCEISSTLRGHEKAVRAIDISADMTTAVSASDDGNLILWDIAGGHDSFVLAGHKGAVLSCCFAQGKNSVISGGKDKVVRVWDVTGAVDGRHVATFYGHTGRVTGITSFPGSGPSFVSCSEDRSVRLWDLAEEKSTRSLTGHEGSLTSIAVTQKSALVLTTSIDYMARVWDIRSSTKCGEVQALKFKDQPVSCTSCPVQETWIGVCAGDGLFIYDTRTWREVAYFRGLSNICCATFSPQRVMCGDFHGRFYSLNVWKAPEGNLF